MMLLCCFKSHFDRVLAFQQPVCALAEDRHSLHKNRVHAAIPFPFYSWVGEYGIIPESFILRCGNSATRLCIGNINIYDFLGLIFFLKPTLLKHEYEPCPFIGLLIRVRLRPIGAQKHLMPTLVPGDGCRRSSRVDLL